MENDYTYANTCHFAKKTLSSNIILHKLEWRNTISVRFA